MIVKRLAQSLRWRFERLAMLLERRRKALVVITYHRLYSQVLDTPFDEGVFGDMSQEYFALQLQWLKLNAEVISEGDVRLGLRCPGTLPQRGVLITFDDGYRDNYTLAYPVLRQMKLPALFFVPTQPLLERRLGWWDLAAYLVKQTKRPSLTLDGISYSLGGPEDRQRLIGVLLERFKTLPEARNQNLLTDLARDLDTVFPSSRLENAELMTFRQLREMIRGGMAVGAHTHSHRVLSTPGAAGTATGAGTKQEHPGGAPESADIFTGLPGGPPGQLRGSHQAPGPGSGLRTGFFVLPRGQPARAPGPLRPPPQFQAKTLRGVHGRRPVSRPCPAAGSVRRRT